MKPRSAADIWQTALGELRVKVSPANYQTWLKDTIGISQRDGNFIIGVPSTFATESLEARLHPLIEKTLAGIIGSPVKAQFQVHLGNGSEQLGPSSPPPPVRQNEHCILHPT